MCCLEELRPTPFPSQPQDTCREQSILCTFKVNIDSDGVALSKWIFHRSSGFNCNFYTISLLDPCMENTSAKSRVKAVTHCDCSGKDGEGSKRPV